MTYMARFGVWMLRVNLLLGAMVVHVDRLSEIILSDFNVKLFCCKYKHEIGAVKCSESSAVTVFLIKFPSHILML